MGLRHLHVAVLCCAGLCSAVQGKDDESPPQGKESYFEAGLIRDKVSPFFTVLWP